MYGRSGSSRANSEEFIKSKLNFGHLSEVLFHQYLRGRKEGKGQKDRQRRNGNHAVPWHAWPGHFLRAAVGHQSGHEFGPGWTFYVLVWPITGSLGGQFLKLRQPSKRVKNWGYLLLQLRVVFPYARGTWASLLLSDDPIGKTFSPLLGGNLSHDFQYRYI